MRIEFGHTAAACALAVACVAAPASAQTPAPASGAPLNFVIEKPTYVSIPLEITVNRPAAEVWTRIGGYCAIAEWLQIAAGCKITSGTDGEVGAVRTVATEVLVAKTEYSYTYTQPVRADRPYILYHGTLEVRPVTPATSKILYTLIYDNSTLPDDAAREKDRATRAARFNAALKNMKALAEGGTLPVPPPPAPTTSAAPAAAPATPLNTVVEKPTYVTIPLELAVNRPAADVWKRVGGYCAISEWLQIAAGCQITSGKDGEVGAVRTVGTEVLVAKTEMSYTYTQPVRADRVYNLYHGTLEVRPVTPTTSKILYTLIYDNSMLPDDTARQEDRERRMTTFRRALNNMKILAEGGTLPPPARSGGAGR